MPSLLVHVKAKMAIYAHERVRGILTGEYGSVFKGRSMDFDDLREYIPGDDIKDIDWKATARCGQVRIKRYIAIRKHNILLVVDTGRNMTATTAGGSQKKATVILLAGIIGFIASKHGDFTGLVVGNSERTQYVPFKTGNVHAERILQAIDKAITPAAPRSTIANQLEYVARNLRRKMIVVVITDEVAIDDRLHAAVRRLRAQHELLWLRVRDADLTKQEEMADVEQAAGLIPKYLRMNAAVVKAFQLSEQENECAFNAAMSRLAIACESVTDESEAVHKIFRLLERHKNARRA